MFSGLVQHLCPIRKIQGGRISIGAPKNKYKLGESISIDGVCLTVMKIDKKTQEIELSFEISPETFEKTTLKKIKKGDRVNFERALSVRDFLGGHIVQGHVDGIATVKKIFRQ